MLGDKAELMSLKEASKQIDSGKYGFPSIENSTVEVNSERSTYENLDYSGMKYLERNIKKLSPLALLSLVACVDEKTFSPYVLSATSPIKILALHGGGGTSASFSSQAGMVSLMNNLPEVEFVFANAPSNLLEVGTGKDVNVWIQDPPGGKGNPTTEPDWADESIAYIDNLVSQEGPFFGILGYSQGAAFIPVYLANTSNTFNIAVMSNGYLPTTHQGLMNTINSVAPFEIKSLIFSGENDFGFKDLATFTS